jgi:UDP-N-acetyl-D-mannosaminuronic acid dehydrogenase
LKNIDPATMPRPVYSVSQDADVTVVGGAGHVGIPLVLAFAETGLKVNVNDLNQGALDQLKSGRLPFIEYGAGAMLNQALTHDRLVFTSSPSQISNRGPVIITIGTPVDEFLNPVRQAVQDCISDLLPHLLDN